MDQTIVLSKRDPTWKKLPFPNSKPLAWACVESVRKTGKTVLVTRFGEPMAGLGRPSSCVQEVEAPVGAHGQGPAKLSATSFLLPAQKTIWDALRG